MLITTLYLIAITAEAMTAALAAGRREMDWVGVCTIACITALGGGSMRDVLLGHYPLSWVGNPEYLAFTVGAALLMAFFAPVMRHLRRLFFWLDALGLVVFSVIGCKVALAMELPFAIVIISGMITGCAGGVLRDVLCNDIPLLFRSELYASVSLLTGLIYMGMLYLLPEIGLAQGTAASVAMVAGLALRMLALRFKWQMPKFVYRDDWD